jgi:hypothetical protein
MRSYGMYDASRGLTLALAAALAGLGLWGAADVGTQTTERFWIAMAIVAGAGLLMALANHVGTWTKGLRLRISPSTFVIAFLPVLVCVGWILVATQPGSGWQEGRLDHWSNSIGIMGLVKSVGLWHGVLAFGFGLVLGQCFDGVPAPTVEEVPAYETAAYDGTAPVADRPPADEPVTAERRWAATRRRDPVTAPPEEAPTTEEPTRVQRRMPTR